MAEPVNEFPPVEVKAITPGEYLDPSGDQRFEVVEVPGADTGKARYAVVLIDKMGKKTLVSAGTTDRVLDAVMTGKLQKSDTPSVEGEPLPEYIPVAQQRAKEKIADMLGNLNQRAEIAAAQGEAADKVKTNLALINQAAKQFVATRDTQPETRYAKATGAFRRMVDKANSYDDEFVGKDAPPGQESWADTFRRRMKDMDMGTDKEGE